MVKYILIFLLVFNISCSEDDDEKQIDDHNICYNIGSWRCEGNYEQYCGHDNIWTTYNDCSVNGLKCYDCAYRCDGLEDITCCK